MRGSNLEADGQSCRAQVEGVCDHLAQHLKEAGGKSQGRSSDGGRKN